MTTKEFTQLAGQQTGPLLNTRLLGTLGILGSSMLLVEGLYIGFQQHGTDQIVGFLEVIYMTAWMSSIAALGLTQAAGKGWGGKTVLIIQLISLMMAAIWSAVHLVVPNPDTDHILYIIGDIAWPFSHMFMNIVAVAVLRAKVWTGWARLTPFWCGLALPAAMLTAVIAGEVALGVVFGLWTTAAFALLGYAVRISNEA